MKTCSKCGFVGENIFFTLKFYTCKKCTSKYNKEYKNKNSIKIKETNNIYVLKNKESIKEYKANYYKANRKKILENKKIYRLENEEKIKNYRIKNKNKIKLNYDYHKKTLTDYYIINVLKNKNILMTSDIKKYPELIKLKREQIKIIRLIKQKQLL